MKEIIICLQKMDKENYSLFKSDLINYTKFLSGYDINFF